MPAQIAAKKFLTEMDLLRLQKYLLMARMAADSTFLVDKEEPGYSSKLERLGELLEQLADGRRPQDRAVQRMDHDARSDRAAAANDGPRLRAAGRQGAAEEAAGTGASLPERPGLPR